MEKNKISNFLTPDISYLLGLITGRGEIQYTNDVKKIIIDFEYKTLESKAIKKVFDQKLHIQTSLDPVVLRLQNIGINTQKVISDKKLSLVLRWQQEDIAWLFIKYLINGTRFSYHDFLIPEPIFETTEANKKEFLRGLADVTAYVRNSNRDQVGKHRVYIEISNKNWFLSTQICQLSQSLNVPTQFIGYGHPNIRGGSGTSWAKEHQIKIYAEDFEKIGFYISHKNEALKELADYNKVNFDKKQSLCTGKSSRKVVKEPHPHEKHEKLPSEINGQHFDNFKEICKCLGCYLQKK
ncbi:MAG: hypothetical protein COS14_14035 [Bacteroidetes bacterium CG02_land_8_20_14_3_00_31_25]|nr:MAG: hypothetical protein COS14_14035 [Bacteroidetes bacterium CG02_land_8_20_14_3_00_31_25]